MYSKAQQLGKHTTNKKKMSRGEYLSYVDFVNDLANGQCQNTQCNNQAQDIHHSYFGAGGRDDRYITSICRECHHAIHHGRDTDKASKLKFVFKTIGKQNWRLYNENNKG
jgi:hypothetical protein